MPLLQGLRQRLDLFANVRPCKLIAPELTPLKNKTVDDINFTVIRENTEGYEYGTGGNYKIGSEDEVEIRPGYNTYKGVKRVIEFAFDYARKEGRTRVHMAEKGMPKGLWSLVFEEVSAKNTAIQPIHMRVDPLAYMMVVAPAHRTLHDGDLAGEPARVVAASAGRLWSDPGDGYVRD